MVDANHAYSVPTAVSLAKQMEKFNISWFEEPVVPEDIDGYRRVQSKTFIPIAGGECSFMRYGFRDMFVGKCKTSSSSENMTNLTGRGGPCVDIAQPDIAAAGGLTEFQKISALGKHLLSHNLIFVHFDSQQFRSEPSSSRLGQRSWPGGCPTRRLHPAPLALHLQPGIPGEHAGHRVRQVTYKTQTLNMLV